MLNRDALVDAQADAAVRALDRWSSDARAQADWEAERRAADTELTDGLAGERRRRAEIRRARLDGDPGSAGLAAVEQAVTGAPVHSDTDPDGDPGDGLLSAFAATERLASYALWQQVCIAATLLVRRARSAPVPATRAVAAGRRSAELTADKLSVMDEVATELALVAPISHGKAHRLTVAARALVTDERLPRTAEALRRGLVDSARLMVLVGRTEPLDRRAAAAVEDIVFGTRGVLSMPLRRFTDVVDRALLEVDARAAEERRRAARRDRRVWLQALPDGQAALTAVGPCEALTAAYAGLDAGARRLRRSGDPRTLDQLRHDLLVAACLGPAGRSGSPDGSGPHPATNASVTPTPTPTSTVSTSRVPTSRVPTSEAPDRNQPASDHADGVAAADDTGRDDASPWFSTTWPDVTASVTVTVSAETLMGLFDAPGHLQGYGPIPAEAIRDLVTNGVFRCAVVDDRHGTVLGLGRSTFTPGYVPGARLRSLLDVLAPECDIPGCTVTVHRADLDHRHPHARGGPTCECNVRPLCRTHHRLKTAGLIRCVRSTDPRDPPGTRFWVTRSGRRYAATDPWLLPPGPDSVHGLFDDGEVDAAGVGDCDPEDDAPPF